MTQIMHYIIVVTLSDTSAWKKISTRPYPTISEIGRSQLDSAQILKESIGPAVPRIENLRCALAFVPVWGCFLLDFSYAFMNTAVFPLKEKNAKPNMHPLPHRRLKKFREMREGMEFSSKFACSQLLADFLG